MIRIALFISLFTLTACATMQDVENLQYNMNLQNQRIEDRMESLSKALASAEQKLAGQIDAASTPVRSTQANLWAEIESLRTQVGSLQGNLEEVRQQSRQTGTDELQELKTRVALLESRLIEISSRLALDFDARPTTPSATGQQPIDPAQALYERGLASFQSKGIRPGRKALQRLHRHLPQTRTGPQCPVLEGGVLLSAEGLRAGYPGLSGSDRFVSKEQQDIRFSAQAGHLFHQSGQRDPRAAAA
jgi:archaellum component FlaC